MATIQGSCIFVLGMHRTGTSAMTGLLTLAGASAGRDLLPPNNANPKGFFENVKVVGLNNKILKLLDSAWDDMRPLPPDWWKAAQFAGCEQDIRDLLVSEFNGVLPVIKDPRLCKTLPLWLQAMTALGGKPLFVLCARSPAAVVQSEKVMKGLPALQSLLLYLDYSLHAEIHTRGHPRVAVAYPDLLADWCTVLKRIATTLGLSLPVDDPAFLAAADDFISQGLNRSDKAEADQLEHCGALATLAGDVFKGLCELDSRRLQTLHARYLETCQLLDPWVTLLDKALIAARKDPCLDFGDITVPRMKAAVSWPNPDTGKFDDANRTTVIYNCCGEQSLLFTLPTPPGRHLRLSICNRPVTVVLRAGRLRSGSRVLWQFDKTLPALSGHSDTVIDITNYNVERLSRWLVLDAAHYLDLDLGGDLSGARDDCVLELDLRVEDSRAALQPLAFKYRLLDKFREESNRHERDQTIIGQQRMLERMREELLRAEAQLELLKDLVYINSKPVQW